MDIWTIYQSPKDYPGKFVARRFELDRPTADVIVADTLEDLRARLPDGLTCIGRHLLDDPVIMEVWL